MGRYDRDQARHYARYYAKAVCHDGAVFTGGGGGGLGVEHFDPGESLSDKNIDGENDCTHFISCCVGDHKGVHNKHTGGKAGGGIPITAHDAIGWGYGITSAPRMVDYLLNRGFAKPIGGQKVFRSTAAPDIEKLEMGDLIAYAASSNGGYTHMAFHLYQGKIACHTNCRLDKDWTDIGVSYGSHVTLLQVVY